MDRSNHGVGCWIALGAGLLAGAIVFSGLLVGGAPSAAAPRRPQVHVNTVQINGAAKIELASVSCVSANDCVAVGTLHHSDTWAPSQSDTPVIMRFDGQRWSKVTAPAPSNTQLHGVDCVSKSACVAVGEQGFVPFIEEMHGTHWAVVPTPSPRYYLQDYSVIESVSCVSVANCTAVGWDMGVGYPRGLEPFVALILKRSSAGWAMTLPAGPLVATPEPSVSGNVVVPANIADSAVLTSVSCGGTVCAAVGQGGYVMHAGSWMTVPTQLDLTAVSCSLDGQCTAIGTSGASQYYSQTGTIAVLSGNEWKPNPPVPLIGTADGVHSVSCISGDSCVVLGGYAGLFPPGNGSGLLIDIEVKGRWYRSTFPQAPSETHQSLTSMSCPSAHDCIAVGPGSVGMQIPSGPVQAYSVRITF